MTISSISRRAGLVAAAGIGSETRRRATEDRRHEGKQPMSDIPRTAGFTFLRDSSAAATDAGDGTEGDGQTLDGWGSVFNREVIIDSWEGRFWEQFASGSMKKSFRES